MELGIDVVPHIRTIDHPIDDTITLIKGLVKKGLTKVLIVTGDRPQSMSVPTFPVKPTSVIRALKKECPELQVYGALDPYRTSFQEELAYCTQKIEAGADGFFTQPFFDPELARIYLEQLEGTHVFAGISPVLTESSLNYWRTKNFAIFPSSFDTSLEANCDVAKSVIETAEARGHHVYLMPIKAPVSDYLSGIFN